MQAHGGGHGADCPCLNRPPIDQQPIVERAVLGAKCNFSSCDSVHWDCSFDQFSFMVRHLMKGIKIYVRHAASGVPWLNMAANTARPLYSRLGEAPIWMMGWSWTVCYIQESFGSDAAGLRPTSQKAIAHSLGPPPFFSLPPPSPPKQEWASGSVEPQVAIQQQQLVAQSNPSCQNNIALQFQLTYSVSAEP